MTVRRPRQHASVTPGVIMQIRTLEPRRRPTKLQPLITRTPDFYSGRTPTGTMLFFRVWTRTSAHQSRDARRDQRARLVLFFVNQTRLARLQPDYQFFKCMVLLRAVLEQAVDLEKAEAAAQSSGGPRETNKHVWDLEAPLGCLCRRDHSRGVHMHKRHALLPSN